ncbi:MAG: hypothetical protein QHH74_01425 [Spirochaetota bacterium]|nr:hypothetical protein [Spirochaetota bacterium]
MHSTADNDGKRARNVRHTDEIGASTAVTIATRKTVIGLAIDNQMTIMLSCD